LSGAESSDEHEPLQRLTDELGAVHERLRSLQESQRQSAEELRNRLATIEEAVELLYDDDAGARRRLRELRTSTEYERAFTDAAPLVSVVIPTWQRIDTLIERAIPSALAQTHENIEVIIVGDASPPETQEAIAALGDTRVTFHNLTFRGPYSENAKRAWLAAGTPGFNAGVALAGGAWIAPLGDDDAFVAEHIEQLLAIARPRRLELAYGRMRLNMADGSSSTLGAFPPRLGQIGLQAAIYHAGLGASMQLELAHAVFGKPNDWGLVSRMMRAGVRIGMLDEVTVDYFPSAGSDAAA
jgi:glycosyltransferase involved in cell wall biosynthesis